MVACFVVTRDCQYGVEMTIASGLLCCHCKTSCGRFYTQTSSPGLRGMPCLLWGLRCHPKIWLGYWLSAGHFLIKQTVEQQACIICNMLLGLLPRGHCLLVLHCTFDFVILTVEDIKLIHSAFSLFPKVWLPWVLDSPCQLRTARFKAACMGGWLFTPAVPYLHVTAQLQQCLFQRARCATLLADNSFFSRKGLTRLLKVCTAYCLHLLLKKTCCPITSA